MCQSLRMNDDAAAALIRMFGTLGATAPRGWARERDGLAALVSGCQAATMNGVLCGRRGSPAALAALLDEVAATGLPHCAQVRDGDPEAVDVVRERGFVAGERVPLMVLADVSTVAVPDDVAVEPLDDFATHLDVMAGGFEAPADFFAPLGGSSLLEQPGVRAYVVRDGDTNVATAIGMTNDDFVGVFDVATLPAYRGRGYGAALTARAVADGAAAGARGALLQSSALGLRVYRRLGFRTVEEWTVWGAPE